MSIPKVDHSKALEQAARFKDITDKAKVARPIDQGADILRRPVDGMDERFGFPSDSPHLL